MGQKSQPRSWSLVSKKMKSKTVAYQEETEINELAKFFTSLLRPPPLLLPPANLPVTRNLTGCLPDVDDCSHFPNRASSDTKLCPFLICSKTRVSERERVMSFIDAIVFFASVITSRHRRYLPLNGSLWMALFCRRSLSCCLSLSSSLYLLH
ncbi:hypothetical protein GBA52_014251 [Prunus armeniaca]|nr:hypothetical protein GBA52_014251 [Prunus armeniaca]